MLVLAAIWKAVTGFFGSIFDFFAKHPMVLAFLVTLVVGIGLGVMYEKHVAGEKYDALVAQVAKDEKARKEKADQVAVDTAKAAAEAKAQIDDLKHQIDAVRGTYETRLADALQHQKIRTVVVPGAKETVYVTQEGNVECRRFPDAFTDTVNQMVDTVNRQLDTNGAK
jgi:hypothetical protein